MKFCLFANATFEAENIDDAFKRLAAHFQQLAEYGVGDSSEDDQLFEGGVVQITKYRDHDGDESR
ncbi:MAG TPA: hypothetical protein VL866_24145 [Pyrinomonadaceae bacterium]|nr:hypothetical protein [Pyrinomonadaceae bacterium]